MTFCFASVFVFVCCFIYLPHFYLSVCLFVYLSVYVCLFTVSGIDATYPAPTRTMFTYRPTTTPVPETTSESTTEVIEMTTMEEPEMTTQEEEETTEESGSGDIGDVKPGTPGGNHVSNIMYN